MLKKVLVGTGIVAVLAAGFLLGSLTLGSAFALTPPSVDDDAAEDTVKGLDTDDIEFEEQVGDQSEIVDDAAEDTVKGPDMDNVENQVEQDGEFDGEF